ncbi:restriction endonuclease [Thermoplasmatales archaeon SW_10_69_26]|nr:MAG: restriction endonuclease [Thermoplasmatales archaeon SW_10_69_26]
MQTALTAWKNSELFSNHFLDDTLPESDAWSAVPEEDVEDAFHDLLQEYRDSEDRLENFNELQLRKRFVNPVLDLLGFSFEIEESVYRGRRRPDYAFFESQEALDDAHERRDQGGDFYRNAIAVGDAKRWGRPLDTEGEHRRDFENPGHQIHVYLQETSASWGILTNGRKWRLYHDKTSHRLDSFYEVNLPTLLEAGDPEAFKYFYLFFRKAAFVEDSTGNSFLDRVYHKSTVFARELGEDLQENVYEAIKLLARGFLSYPENDLDRDDLELIHDSSLIYLYRLIFVLYAESEGRDLLDTRNRIYREKYSLNQLKQEISEDLQKPDPGYYEWEDTLWHRLQRLFTLIDQGSQARGIPEEDLHIPPYNGGLFRTDPSPADSREVRFLVEHKIGDAHLARVIELLTTRENGEGGQKVFVDYTSLDIRHLGSIYERLLEYKLNFAEEPLAVEDGEYKPIDPGQRTPDIPEGEVYLTTDSGDRRATGSYYTPEYIVEHIIENTLGPIVEDVRSQVLQSATSTEGFAEDFANSIFELRILDPAMGSGHFLTNAIDYLAREIIRTREAQARSEGVETVEEGHDIYWARRQVAQRCIYGVDLNPLAVELAKVSLWLRTLAAEQPLAFLDHRLKAGNSLIGSDIEEVLTENGSTPRGQLTLRQSFSQARQRSLEHVTDRFEELLSIENESIEDIKEMEAVYREVREDDLYTYLRSMANVHTAEAYGLQVPSDAYQQMAEALLDGSWAAIQEKDWYQEAQDLAAEENFFHWQLEFPIAFYEQDGSRQEDPGFDAIIGNPPYAEIQRIPEKQRDYYRATYKTPTGNYDIYVIFVEKGTDLLRGSGRFGFILPNKIFRVDYGEPLRERLAQNSQVAGILDFGSTQVFADSATTYTAILLLSGSEREKPFTYWKLADGGDPSTVKRLPYEETDWRKATWENESLSAATWTFQSEEIESLLESVWEKSIPLSEIAEAIGRGTSSGCDDVFQVHVEKASEGLVSCSSDVEESFQLEADALRQPIHSTDFDNYLFDGDDSKRFIWVYDEDYELLQEEEFTSRYPETWSYLERNRDELEERADYSVWYDYSAPRNLRIHDSAEILIPLLADGPSFADYPKPQSEYVLMASGGFGIAFDSEESNHYDPRYILSVINSDLLFRCLQANSNVFRGGYITCTKQYFQDLPIREIEFSTPEPEREKAADELSSLYETYLEGREDQDGEEIRARVSEELEADRDDVVHDFLSTLANHISDLRQEREGYELKPLDYFAPPFEGPKLPDIGLFQPTHDSDILEATADEFDKLRVGDVQIKEENGVLRVRIAARYKPEDEEEQETDQWGYTETEYLEAFTLRDLDDRENALVQAVVPAIVKEGGGIADFRESATKTNSLLDRLKELRLPLLDQVGDDLDRYVRVQEKVESLDIQISKTDDLINQIVHLFYGLTEEEIDLVQSEV